MNKKLYYEQPYLTECECTVLSVKHIGNKTEVITDVTIFYPECGGQSGDVGTLGDLQITDTQKDEQDNSVLILPPNSDIEVNRKYLAKLNWNHRYKYMIMHTAQHLLSGLLYTNFGIGTESVHLGEKYLTIEVNTASVSEETIKKLICIANQKIAESHKINYYEMSHSQAEALGLRRSIKVDTDVRIVEIENVDKIACGGVHVSKTSELSLITYAKSEQIRGHLRLYFKTGQEALASIEENRQIIETIQKKFSCSTEEIIPKIENLTETVSNQKAKISEISAVLANIEIQNNIQNSVAVFQTELELSAFVKSVGAYKDLAMFVYNKEQWMMALTGKFQNTDFNAIKSILFPVLQAKGGGRFPIFQGIYACQKPANEIRDLLLSILKIY